MDVRHPGELVGEKPCAREHALVEECWEPFAPFRVYYCYRRRTCVATCEETLIESAAHGDQEAFRQLWQAHHAGALAEEITQGAFLLAWRGLPRFKKGCPFHPWLMCILYRHALDVMEKQGAS